MARKCTFWCGVGRQFAAVIVVAFGLPFFGMSRDGEDVSSFSGLDLVAGCTPTTSGDPGDKRPGPIEQLEREVTTRPQPLAIIALVLVVLLFGSTWMSSRKAARVGVVLSVATTAMLLALRVRMLPELQAVAEAGQRQPDIGYRNLIPKSYYGLWYTLTMLAISAALATAAGRRHDEFV